MRLLVVASVFPPRVIGGAEISAEALAKWLRSNGHEVGVLTVAETSEDELRGESIDGITVWRLRWPRQHTQHFHQNKSALAKLRWHIQDHLDPRNRDIVKAVMKTFNPEAVVVQVLSGIGHNVIPELHRGGRPVFYFLHDLTLGCLRTSMFRNGANCRKQCIDCALSSRLKMHFLKRNDIHFISPSKSNLDTLNGIIKIEAFQQHVIPNLDLEEARKMVPRHHGLPVRLLYLGRLDPVKGVEFLLQVLDDIQRSGGEFHLCVVGGGASEATLKKKYGDRSWVEFTGKVPPPEVPSYVCNADVLLLPSLWRENHPGVVRQALRAGVPAIVSDSGGSKEMIVDGLSGLVIPTGDHSAWKHAIWTVICDEAELAKLQQGAKQEGERYSADTLGNSVLDLMLSCPPPAADLDDAG